MTASACPSVAATRVPRTSPNRLASSARSTRPPSIGNAGIRLNSSRPDVGDQELIQERCKRAQLVHLGVAAGQPEHQ